MKSFEAASDFETFIYNLMVDRREFAFEITNIDLHTLDFIRNMLRDVFCDEQFNYQFDEFYRSVNDKWGFKYSTNKGFYIELGRNLYFDGSGYRDPFHKRAE